MDNIFTNDKSKPLRKIKILLNGYEEIDNFCRNNNITQKYEDKKYKVNNYAFIKNMVYRRDDIELLKGSRKVIEDFGLSHKQSGAVWKTMKDTGYLQRIERACIAWNFKRNVFKQSCVAADIGCGPRAGVFFRYGFPKMYAVDPSWTFYQNNRLVRLVTSDINVIEDYAQLFQLPEKADVMFSLNAVNHSGDINKSIHNMMSNLSLNGTLFFHVHLREDDYDPGHPMILSEEIMREAFKNYKTKVDIYTYDPSRKREVGMPNGHKTFVCVANHS